VDAVDGELKLFTELDNRVALLKIFPGFNAFIYQSLFDISKIKGIILETFGAGNAPTDLVFDSMIEEYLKAGGIVLNITQCNSGSVHQGLYETSSFFQKVGVIGGGCVMITVVEVWQLLKSLTVITYVPEDKLDIVYVPPPIEHEEEVERISAGQDNPNPEGGDVGPVKFKLYPRQDPAEEGPTVPPQKFSVICPVF
jgi:hypothetical protein